MEILDKFHKITPSWHDLDFLHLDYEPVEFLDKMSRDHHASLGLNVTNMLYHFSRNPRPKFLIDIAEWFRQNLSWHKVSASIYRMPPHTIMPIHVDHFSKYMQSNNLDQKQRSHICRAIVFLQDWQAGHYLQVKDSTFIKWQKGQYVVWSADDEHAAGNIGNTDRFTVQVTGMKIE